MHVLEIRTTALQTKPPSDVDTDNYKVLCGILHKTYRAISPTAGIVSCVGLPVRRAVQDLLLEMFASAILGHTASTEIDSCGGVHVFVHNPVIGLCDH